MKYFIDSADTKLIEKWSDRLGESFAGVTTNLTMIKGKKALREYTDSLTFSGKKPQLTMFQVQNQEEVDIIQHKKYFVAKISMLQDNFELIKYIKEKNIRIAATTCYDLIQINQAIEMKFDYTMVYYAKNPYKCLLEDAVKLKHDSKSPIKLVAASIHTPEEVTHALKSGIGYITVRPDVLDLLFNNKDAIKDISNV